MIKKRIVKSKSNYKNKSNYFLHIENNDSLDFSITNIIYLATENGYFSAIVKYIYDPEFVEGLISENKNFSEFSGSLEYYTLGGKLFGSVNLKNGKAISTGKQGGRLFGGDCIVDAQYQCFGESETTGWIYPDEVAVVEYHCYLTIYTSSCTATSDDPINTSGFYYITDPDFTGSSTTPILYPDPYHNVVPNSGTQFNLYAISSTAESLFWSGINNNDVSDPILKNRMVVIENEMNFLESNSPELHDLFKDVLQDPYSSGIESEDDRAIFGLIRYQLIQAFQQDFYGDPNDDPIINGKHDVTSRFNSTLIKTIDLFCELNRLIESLSKLPTGLPNISKPLRYILFANLVKSDAPFDLKSLGHGYSEVEIGSFSIYEGQENRYDAYGNIAFGAACKAIGIPGTIAEISAGLYQIYGGKSDWTYFSSFFDEPIDNDNINLGFNKFNFLGGCI